MNKTLISILAVTIAAVIVLSVVFLALKDTMTDPSNDLDGDGISDESDLDDDNDGVPDEVEVELTTDPENAEDAIHGTLVYDPDGSNYAARGSDDEAYLLTKTSSGDIESKKVFLSNNYNLEEPLVIEAFFQVENGDTILAHVKDTINEDNSIENADLTLTDTVAGCFFNHTFGFGMDGTTGVFFISLIKAPAIFTTVSMSGVYIGVDELTDLDILDVDIPDEVAYVIASFDIGETLGVKILLTGAVDYEDTVTVDGDVLDIITPEDVAVLAQVLPFGLDAGEMTEMTNFLDYIDMHLLILLEEGSNMDNIDIWFVVVPDEYPEGMYDGVVSISVAEAQLDSLFGSSLPTEPSWLDLHVGASNQEGSPSSYVSMSIMDLWDALGSTTRTVQTYSYGLVVTLEKAIEVLGGAFNSDISSFLDIGEFRNPAFALMIDYNITNYFSEDYSIKEYVALAFVPNAGYDFGLFARLDCTGVMYDLGEFLGMEFDFPVIFCDYMDKDTDNTVVTTLSSIYNDPENDVNDQFITHINTSGRLLGVSMKSVAKFTKFIYPSGMVLMMSHSPVDIGVYDLSDPEDGTNYHLATIYPKIGTAPNYLFKPAYVEGYYLNLNYAWAFLTGDPEGLAEESGGSGGFGDGIFIGAINELLSALGSNSRILNGVLIIDTITETSDPSTFTFLEVDHYLVEDESCVVPAIYGKAQFSGSVSWSVWVTAELEAGDGTSTFLRCKMVKDGGLFDGLDFIPFFNGDVGRFLIANGLKYLPAGTYDVTIDITGWTPGSLFLGAQNLGSYQYQMVVSEDYNYSASDPNADYSGAISVSDGTLTRSLGYQNDEADWYYIYLNQGELLRVEYQNVEDANVEVSIYDDPTGDSLCTTDWSWTTVLQVVADESGTFYIKVVYDDPGIYSLDISTITDDDNNDFSSATNISMPEGFYYPMWAYWLQDGVATADPNDYYKVYLKRGQYLWAEYENIGGANVELFLYNSTYVCIDDTAWDLSTDVHGFAKEDGWFYLRIALDTADGFYTLVYYVRNGTPNLDPNTAIIVWDGSEVSGWLTQTPAGEMEHWYVIYVLNGETITVTDNGPVDMWLWDSHGTMVDTTDLDLFNPNTVTDDADQDGWYFLETHPGGPNEDYTLNFSVD